MPYMRDARGLRLDSFYPTRDLPAVVAHFDASQIPGTNGQNVAKWRDLLGVSVAVQATTANQPTLVTAGQNGLNYLHFGATAFLADTSFAVAGWLQPGTLPQPNTIFVVFRLASAVTAVQRGLLCGQAGNSNDLIIDSATQVIKPYAGTNAAQGGLALNDDTWHVAAVVFDTASCSVFIDGFLQSVSVTQAQGVQALSKLLIGAAAAGGSPMNNGDIAEVILCNGRLSPKQLWHGSKALASKWGLTATFSSDQQPVTLTDTTSGNGTVIRTWLPRTPAVPTTLVLWAHPADQNEQISPSYFAYPAVHALVNEGCAVVASNMHGTVWANDVALADLRNAYDWYVSNYGTPTKVILLGASMGGLAVSLAAAGQTVTIPNLAGVALIDGVTSLSSLYANASYTTEIDTSYGITRGTLSGATTAGATSLPTTASFPTIGTQLLVGNGTANVETVTTTGASSGTAVAVTATTKTHSSADQVSDYPTKTVNHDAALKSAAAFSASVRWRFYASTADTTVTKATNSDAFAALIGSRVPESTVVSHIGGHLATTGIDPQGLIAFLRRC